MSTLRSILSLLFITQVIYAKSYSRCELHDQLLNAYKIPSDESRRLTCIAQRYSALSTNVIVRDRFGIFQISKNYCGEHEIGGECGIKCSKLLDDDLTDDISCTKKVFEKMGKSAWNLNKSPGCEEEFKYLDENCHKEILTNDNGFQVQQDICGFAGELMTLYDISKIDALVWSCIREYSKTGNQTDIKEGEEDSCVKTRDVECAIKKSKQTGSSNGFSHWPGYDTKCKNIPKHICFELPDEKSDDKGNIKEGVDQIKHFGYPEVTVTTKKPIKFTTSTEISVIIHDEDGNTALNSTADISTTSESPQTTEFLSNTLEKPSDDENPTIEGYSRVRLMTAADDNIETSTATDITTEISKQMLISTSLSQSTAESMIEQTTDDVVLEFIDPIDKCLLAKRMSDSGRFPQNLIPIFVCIAEHESGLNLSFVNTDGLQSRYGLFQIDNQIYCSTSAKINHCDVTCAHLVDDEFDDDFECLRHIFKKEGLDYWPSHEKFCKNVHSDSLDYCHEKFSTSHRPLTIISTEAVNLLSTESSTENHNLIQTEAVTEEFGLKSATGILDFCEFSHQIFLNESMELDDLMHYVCIVDKTSNLTFDGSDEKFGIFGLNANSCGKSEAGGFCSILCSDLSNQDFTDDLKCAMKIYKEFGLKEWNIERSDCEAYKNKIFKCIKDGKFSKIEEDGNDSETQFSAENKETESADIDFGNIKLFHGNNLPVLTTQSTVEMTVGDQIIEEDLEVTSKYQEKFDSFMENLKDTTFNSQVTSKNVEEITTKSNNEQRFSVSNSENTDFSTQIPYIIFEESAEDSSSLIDVGIPISKLNLDTATVQDPTELNTTLKYLISTSENIETSTKIPSLNLEESADTTEFSGNQELLRTNPSKIDLTTQVTSTKLEVTYDEDTTIKNSFLTRISAESLSRSRNQENIEGEIDEKEENYEIFKGNSHKDQHAADEKVLEIDYLNEITTQFPGDLEVSDAVFGHNFQTFTFKPTKIIENIKKSEQEASIEEQTTLEPLRVVEISESSSLTPETDIGIENNQFNHPQIFLSKPIKITQNIEKSEQEASFEEQTTLKPLRVVEITESSSFTPVTIENSIKSVATEEDRFKSTTESLYYTSIGEIIQEYKKFDIKNAGKLNTWSKRQNFSENEDETTKAFSEDYEETVTPEMEEPMSTLDDSIDEMTTDLAFIPKISTETATKKAFVAHDYIQIDKCTLAKYMNDSNISENLIPTFICIAEHESQNLNVSSVATNGAHRKYGLFQIDDEIYCSTNERINECDVLCEHLIDNQFGNDFECALHIYRKEGFSYWESYEKSCQNVDPHSIDHCFEQFTTSHRPFTTIINTNLEVNKLQTTTTELPQILESTVRTEIGDLDTNSSQVVRKFELCELARELYAHNISINYIPSYLCIAGIKSQFEIRIPNESDQNYGLFAINSEFCGQNESDGVCFIKCSDLWNQNISDDIECIYKVRDGISILEEYDCDFYKRQFYQCYNNDEFQTTSAPETFKKDVNQELKEVEIYDSATETQEFATTTDKNEDDSTTKIASMQHRSQNTDIEAEVVTEDFNPTDQISTNKVMDMKFEATTPEYSNIGHGSTQETTNNPIDSTTSKLLEILIKPLIDSSELTTTVNETRHDSHNNVDYGSISKQIDVILKNFTNPEVISRNGSVIINLFNLFIYGDNHEIKYSVNPSVAKTSTDEH